MVIMHKPKADSLFNVNVISTSNLYEPWRYENTKFAGPRRENNKTAQTREATPRPLLSSQEKMCATLL